MRFGIGDGSEHTLEEVGQSFQVTRERIRQIKAKPLRKLPQAQGLPGRQPDLAHPERGSRPAREGSTVLTPRSRPVARPLHLGNRF